jgi:hypothetical protein
MEGLEAATSAAAPAAPAPAPAPAAAPAASAPAPAASPAPATSGGGAMSSIKEAFASLNWIEVGLGALGVAALFKTMDYYNYMQNVQKSARTELENKIDDLSIKVADLQSATQRDELLGNRALDGLFY